MIYFQVLSSGKISEFPILASGGEGIIYDLDDKVLKVAYTDLIEFIWKRRRSYRKLFEKLAQGQYPFIVSVYDYHLSQEAFCYTMEKLIPLSKTEKKIIAPFNGTTSKYILKNCKNSQLLRFIQKAADMKLYSFDIQDFNIMKDHNGNWKFIDLESFIHY